MYNFKKIIHTELSAKGMVFEMTNKTKIIVAITLIMMVVVYQIGKTETKTTYAEETVTVNDTAIRIRIIPNSNKYEDQQAKKMVRFAIDEYLANNKIYFETIDSTRQFIVENIGEIEKTVAYVLDTINYDEEFEVSYGAHLFPEKQYNGATYDAGYYESLVITIGDGLGNNWWCFMNPDLCLGPSATKAEESDDHWNAQYTAMETTQEAFQTKQFKSYFGEVFETLFGGRDTKVNENTYAKVDQSAKANWYLYEDEY